MALKVFYYGQNIGTTVPDVILTGNPAIDQPALAAAGYMGGTIVCIKPSVNLPGSVPVVVPCNGDTATYPPFATLINDPGEFAGSIGPSGSGKTPCVRALWFGAVDSVSFDSTDTYTLGGYLYCGGAGHSATGKYTAAGHKGTQSFVVGICTSLPGAASFYGPGTTAQYAAQGGGVNLWLGVASLL
jgi:hypothetical protein